MKVSYFFYALALQVASVMAAPADEANQLRTDKTDALQKDTSLAAQGQLLGSDVQEQITNRSLIDQAASHVLTPAMAIAAQKALATAFTTRAAATVLVAKQRLVRNVTGLPTIT
ncbi:hypothetical protein PRK78_006305 [Emydomyces testavorans]|uniref:Uncharacterized protein n=1 Tax=Emydomyces testavorans TaxID=2070801 RepID=A0AAF0DN87_9EURO|nr:hypothetical protein PRK78_006305 [Emydomyces testavorans]